MKIIKSRPEHAESILKVRRIVRAKTYAGYPKELTQAYLLKQNTVTAKLIYKESLAISDSKSKYWVVEEKDKIKGYLKITKNPKQLIDYIHILPEYQGQGLGNQLLEIACTSLDRKKPIYLEVAQGNDRAFNWYLRHGWRWTGKIQNGTPLPGGKGYAKEYIMILDPI